uniref:Pentatricopeptide repeat-containing protein n=1 Tax=Fagus sylvatica TaxID=28930 RepID=A0A2N9FFD3_FAGSY
MSFVSLAAIHLPFRLFLAVTGLRGGRKQIWALRWASSISLSPDCVTGLRGGLELGRAPAPAPRTGVAHMIDDLRWVLRWIAVGCGGIVMHSYRWVLSSGETSCCTRAISYNGAYGQHPNPLTYGILLDGLCKNEHFDKAMTLLQEIEDNKLHPNIVIYNILIDGLCNVGKLAAARELFYSLPAKGLQPNVQTYTIMIKGLCKEGLIDEVDELLKKMDGNGCSLDNCTYNTIIQGLLQHNETSKAMEYIQIMVYKGFSANAVTVNG